MTLLEMSVAAGVMIGAVSVIRAVAMDKLPKKTFLALWAVVLLRLLVPVSLPSPMSLYNAVPERIAPNVRHFAPAITFYGVNAERAVTMRNPLMELLPLLWALGALAMAVFFLVSWFRCRRLFRESLPVEDGFAQAWLSAHTLRRRVELRRTDRVSSPLTYGLLRPVILLPSAMNWADRDRLEYVLTHERYHIRRLDGLWKLLLTGALCLHWFNPLVWCMYVLANRDLELSCDESVVRSYGESVKAAYALTLIVEEKRSMLMPLCNSFSKNAIEERVRAIMKQKKMTIAAISAAVVLVAAVTIVFATTAPKPEEPQEPQAAVTTTGRGRTKDWPASAQNDAETAIQNLGWSDDEMPKPDPETGHYYTKAQYNQVAALKTEGYDKKSIAEFNRTIHAAMEEYGDDYDKSLMYAWESLRSELPAGDPLASFVYYTLETSLDEYDTKLRAVREGKEAVYEFDGRAERNEYGDVFGEQVSVGEAYAYFTIYYAILDQDKLTVGERDQFLMSITSGVQKYLDGLDLRKADVMEEEELVKLFQAELDRLGKAAGTTHISYTRGGVDNVYAYVYS